MVPVEARRKSEHSIPGSGGQRYIQGTVQDSRTEGRMCEQAVKSSSKPSLKISGGARQEATESYGLEFERVPYGPFREVDAGGVVGDCFFTALEQLTSTNELRKSIEKDIVSPNIFPGSSGRFIEDVDIAKISEHYKLAIVVHHKYGTRVFDGEHGPYHIQHRGNHFTALFEEVPIVARKINEVPIVHQGKPKRKEPSEIKRGRDSKPKRMVMSVNELETPEREIVRRDALKPPDVVPPEERGGHFLRPLKTKDGLWMVGETVEDREGSKSYNGPANPKECQNMSTDHKGEKKFWWQRPKNMLYTPVGSALKVEKVKWCKYDWDWWWLLIVPGISDYLHYRNYKAKPMYYSPDLVALLRTGMGLQWRGPDFFQRCNNRLNQYLRAYDLHHTWYHDLVVGTMYVATRLSEEESWTSEFLSRKHVNNEIRRLPGEGFGRVR